jgi:predicted O-methyltransferase YrrM
MNPELHYLIYLNFIKKANENTVFVEIGAWKGVSTIFMASSIKKLDKNIKFYTVDTWKGSQGTDLGSDMLMEKELNKNNGDMFNVFFQNIKNADLCNYVIPLRMLSSQACHFFNPESIDFLYIDAAHDYNSIKDDINNWHPKVKKHGIIAGHDYSKAWPGVVKAVNESLKNIVVIPEWWIWLHRKETKLLI